jgi:phage baseplate assembly protein V
MDIAELSRRIENLLRLGTVAQVDHAQALCRVESGGVLTGWLPWFERRTGQTRTWDPPTIGEQVMVLSPSGEAAGGCVLRGLFRAAHPAPDASPTTHVIDYPDGARIAYDHASGALTATGIQTARIDAAVSVTFDTPDVYCTNRLTVDGLLTYRDGLRGSGGESNGNIVTGDFIHGESGVLSSYGIVLHTHHHTDPAAGNPT